MINILITGSAGFIGSKIVESLLKKNYFVIGIDNFLNLHLKKVYVKNLKILKNYKNFSFYKINLLNQKKIGQIIEQNQPNFIIHCAAKTNVRESEKNPTEYLKNNVLGTQILLEAVKKYSPKSKIILLSSSSVYGEQKKFPLKEKNILNPISPYGLSKYFMEQLAKFYSRYFYLKIIIIRPSSVYGPRGRPDMAPSLLIKAAIKGIPFIKYGNSNNNRRDWVYIEDFIAGIIQIIENNFFPSFDIFNFGTGETVGIDEFILIAKDLIKKYLNKDVEIIKKTKKNLEVNNNHLSIKKAKKILRYNPKIGFKEGFKKILEDYKH